MIHELSAFRCCETLLYLAQKPLAVVDHAIRW